MVPLISEIVGNGLCAVPGTFRIQPVWLKESTCQRNRREWAKCRSGPGAKTTRVDKTELPPRHVIPTVAKRSGGIFPSSKNNLRKVKLATWEDPSTPFHFGRDDTAGCGTIHPHGLYSLRCHGDESSPLHCVILFNCTGYSRNVAGDKIAAPIGVVPFNCTGSIRYAPRNGTQAVPYGFADGFNFLTNVF